MNGDKPKILAKPVLQTAIPHVCAILLLALAMFSTGCKAATDWDVTATGQPSTEAEFTVTEGTWMSLSVSPDGKTIVFDLLGDIYRIPATGGDAQLIHGGPAMQQSPRFGPDGKKLLYLSDASGSDNLWISNVDGSHARQVTHAGRDILAGPAWGPQGAYLAAARTKATFPKTRSSDIRVFNLGGGRGRELIQEPENGRDVEGANFSSDGRYLYYTEKVTNPNIFADANHINHVIKRRDLHTGKTKTLIGGFGGAIAPEISPDGSLLAFVRRVKDKTVLFVYNTKTHEQRPIYADLDRDQQSDFLPHSNYYPRYDWFPDNRHLAIWGKGHLFKVDAKTQQVTKIPFSATVHKRYVKPPRFTQDLAPERVHVRALRHPAVAPDGSEIAFHAIGHIWRQGLPKGQPRRLTRAHAFEFEPAYSDDGKRLAYVAWDDQKGSTLKVMDLGSGKTRAVIRSPGVIRQPAFSPNGGRLTYWVEDGNNIMGGYQAKGGLYWASIQGGGSHRVADEGIAPSFSRDGQRIYYSYTATDNTIYASSANVSKLDSVNLNGNDVREHAVGPDTSELRISANHRWISFKEYQQYYVAPYHETGHPIVLGYDRDEVPVKTLTRYSGFGLTWSGPADTAYWTLGAKIYRADMKRQFSSDAALPKVYANIDLSVPADVPKGKLAFVHGRIITMKGDQVIDDGTVVVKGNRIVSVGPADKVSVPDDAKVIDVGGKTVMPGLVDMHGHIDCCYPSDQIPQQLPGRYAALAFGVTTNWDQYSSKLPNYESTEMTRAGIIVGPRFIGSGGAIHGRRSKPDTNFNPIRNYQDARDVMTRKRALGGTFIKSYKQPMRQQRQQLVKAARDAGIMADVEGGSDFYNNITEIQDGYTILEHALPVANYYDDIVQLMAHGDTANTPTLIVAFGEIFGENYMYQHTQAWKNPKIKQYVQQTTSNYSAINTPYGAPPYVRGMTTLHAVDSLYDIGFRSVARSINRLDQAGVRINVGSHGQINGLAMHWEMWLMAQGGMSNMHVLRAATINGAKTIGLDDQIGSLEPGKLADLIVLRGNPLKDIHETKTVEYTLSNGRLYNSLTMNEIGNHDKPREPFYWELPDYRGIDWNKSWASH